jgi:hypothetical protein
MLVTGDWSKGYKRLLTYHRVDFFIWTKYCPATGAGIRDDAKVID